MTITRKIPPRNHHTNGETEAQRRGDPFSVSLNKQSRYRLDPSGPSITYDQDLLLPLYVCACACVGGYPCRGQRTNLPQVPDAVYFVFV